MAKTLNEAAITTANARKSLPIGVHWRGIDPDVQLCVLDYFPTFRRHDLRRPHPLEMLNVKGILESAGLHTVVVQTALGHVGPG